MRRRITLSQAVETAPVELTILGKGTHAEGRHLRVAGDLRVDGEVKVDELVAGERVVVSPSGKLRAGRLRARDVIVAGEVEATMDVESSLVVKDTGRMTGTIRAARLIVEEGGICDGSFSVGAEAQGGPGSMKDVPLPSGLEVRHPANPSIRTVTGDGHAASAEAAEEAGPDRFL